MGSGIRTLCNVVVRNFCVIGTKRCIASHVRYHGHSFDTNDTFESQIRLIAAQTMGYQQGVDVYKNGSTYARGPAKSSVDIWAAGIKASSIKYCVHWSRIAKCWLR